MALLDGMDFQTLNGEGPQPSKSGASSGVDLSNTERSMPSEAFQHRFGRSDQLQQADEPERTLVGVLPKAAKNFFPSVGNVVLDTAKALTVNADETIKGAGQIVSGLSSKAYGALGGEQTPEEKAKKEAAVNAIGKTYADDYGSWQGFLKVLEENPGKILADLSLPLSGGAGALAKTARAGSMAEKALNAASKVAQFADPVQAAVEAASVAAKVPVKLTGKISGMRSGVSSDTFADIYNLARQGEKSQKESFALGRTGEDPAVFGRVSDAFENAAEEASQQYVAGMSSVNQTKPIDWQAVANKIATEKNNLLSSNGTIVSGNKQIWDALTAIENDVQGYLGGNIAAADHFKRSIYNAIKQTHGWGSPSGQALNRIAGDVKSAISAVDPEYIKVMDQWQDWINTATELKTAGVKGDRAGISTALEKLLKSLKNPAKRKNTIDVLAKYDDGIPYLLAGYATRPMFRGNPSLMDLALGGLGYYAAHHPIGAAGAAFAMSPRAGSVAQTGFGTIAKYGSKATRPAITYPVEQLRHVVEEDEKPKMESSTTAPSRKLGYDDLFAPDSGVKASGATASSRELGYKPIYSPPVGSKKYQNTENPYDSSQERELLSTPVVGADKSYAIGSPVGPNQTGIRPPEGSDLFESRIVPIESQGRQSALSKKGAIGVSQIMPETGPEAAALAGEPWSLERLKTDRDYNLKLGKAYFNHLLNIFKDPVVAAAAYNGGMGAVSRALKEAEKTGVNWLSLLEEETQNYVRKFTKSAASGGRIGRASGGRISSHASVAARLVRAAEKAKKSQSQTTEALLEHSDDAIANALEIANKHI